jgi:hypothetical protein
MFLSEMRCIFKTLIGHHTQCHRSLSYNQGYNCFVTMSLAIDYFVQLTKSERLAYLRYLNTLHFVTKVLSRALRE